MGAPSFAPSAKGGGFLFVGALLAAPVATPPSRAAPPRFCHPERSVFRGAEGSRLDANHKHCHPACPEARREPSLRGRGKRPAWKMLRDAGEVRRVDSGGVRRTPRNRRICCCLRRRATCSARHASWRRLIYNPTITYVQRSNRGQPRCIVSWRGCQQTPSRLLKN